MYEVEKPKVPIFGIKNILHQSGKDLKMLRNWFLTGLENGRKDYIHCLMKECFSKCFFPNMGSEVALRLQRKATPVSVLIY